MPANYCQCLEQHGIKPKEHCDVFYLVELCNCSKDLLDPNHRQRGEIRSHFMSKLLTSREPYILKSDSRAN